MNKKLIVFAFIVLLLVAGFLLLYFKVIIPNRNLSNETISLSVCAEYENKKIETGMLINGIKYNLTDSYEIIEFKKGSIVNIKNININNQSYYIRSQEVNLSKNTRIDFKLAKPKETIIKKSSAILRGDDIFEINLEIDSYLEDAFICLKWSYAYYFVFLENHTQSDKIERYQTYDRCYDIENIDGKQDFNVTFKYSSTPLSSDYINLVIGTKQFPEFDKIETIK